MSDETGPDDPPPSALAGALVELENVLRSNGDPGPDRWARGTDRGSVDAALRPLVGADLPEEVYAWFEWHNGFEWHNLAPGEPRMHFTSFPELDIQTIEHTATMAPIYFGEHNNLTLGQADLLYSPDHVPEWTICPLPDHVDGWLPVLVQKTPGGPWTLHKKDSERHGKDRMIIPFDTLDGSPTPTLTQYIVALTEVLRTPEAPIDRKYPFRRH